jgi:hypothetical protein
LKPAWRWPTLSTSSPTIGGHQSFALFRDPKTDKFGFPLGEVLVNFRLRRTPLRSAQPAYVTHTSIIRVEAAIREPHDHALSVGEHTYSGEGQIEVPAKVCRRYSAGETLTTLAPSCLRIPTKSAVDSERRRPPIPIEAGQGFR